MDTIVNALTNADIGKFFRYTYILDQGKGEITTNDNGMYKIGAVGFNSDANKYWISTFAGIQWFPPNTPITLYDKELPTANK